MKKGIIITIDGPASAGKGTVAKIVARKLNMGYLDTGAMYRCAALLVKSKGIDIKDDETIIKTLKSSQIKIKNIDNDEPVIEIDGKNVNEEIRTPEISILSSDIATKRSVREYITSLQKKIGKSGNIVAEGRDMGTYVFPQAEFKFYIDASLKERGNRRFNQLINTSSTHNIEDIIKDLQKRDDQDKNRSLAPLHPASNAVIIDTTQLNINQVVELIINKVRGVYN
jgi:CMP/dCMP kinase